LKSKESKAPKKSHKESKKNQKEPKRAKSVESVEKEPNKSKGTKKMVGVIVARGISPEKWGRVTWAMLHGLAYVAIARPTLKRVRQVRLVVLCMQHLLPCKECRENMLAKLAALPAPFLSAKRGAVKGAWDVARWVHDLHNLTNKKTKKAHWNVSYHDGFDGLLAPMDADRLREFTSRATLAAAEYIARCLAERKGQAEAEAEAEAEAANGSLSPSTGAESKRGSYKKAVAAYVAFRALVRGVLGNGNSNSRKKGAAVGGKRCATSPSSCRSSRRRAGRTKTQSRT
jgi:hypothetical protein